MWRSDDHDHNEDISNHSFPFKYNRKSSESAFQQSFDSFHCIFVMFSINDAILFSISFYWRIFLEGNNRHSPWVNQKRILLLLLLLQFYSFTHGLLCSKCYNSKRGNILSRMASIRKKIDQSLAPFCLLLGGWWMHCVLPVPVAVQNLY